MRTSQDETRPRGLPELNKALEQLLTTVMARKSTTLKRIEALEEEAHPFELDRRVSEVHGVEIASGRSLYLTADPRTPRNGGGAQEGDDQDHVMVTVTVYQTAENRNANLQIHAALLARARTGENDGSPGKHPASGSAAPPAPPVRTTSLASRPEENSGLVLMHPVVAAYYLRDEVITALENELQKLDHSGEWDNALLVSEALIDVLNDRTRSRHWPTANSGKRKGLQLGRLKRAHPEMARKIVKCDEEHRRFSGEALAWQRLTEAAAD